MKIQINLYDYRDVDKVIIENLGLKNTISPNSYVKEILYKLAMSVNSNSVKEKPCVVPEKEIEKPKPTKSEINSKLMNSVSKLDIF